MKWLAKPILWLMTSVIPVFIAACYGPAYDGDDDWDTGDGGADRYLKGKVVNPTDEGIPGIQVSCVGDNDGGVYTQAFTMAGDGAFTLALPPAGCDVIEVKDVDGAENGSYESTQISLEDNSEVTVVLHAAE